MNKKNYLDQIQNNIGPYLPVELTFLIVNCPASIVKKKREHIIQVILLALFRNQLNQKYLASHNYLQKMTKAKLAKKKQRRKHKKSNAEDFWPKKKFSWQYNKAKEDNKPLYHQEQSLCVVIARLYPEITEEELATNYQALTCLIETSPTLDSKAKAHLGHQAKELAEIIASKFNNFHSELIDQYETIQGSTANLAKISLLLNTVSSQEPGKKQEYMPMVYSETHIKQVEQDRIKLIDKISSFHPAIQLMLTGKVLTQGESGVKESSLGYLVDKLLFRHKNHLNLFYNNYRMYNLLSNHDGSLSKERLEQHMCSYMLLNVVPSNLVEPQLIDNIGTLPYANFLDSVCEDYLSKYNNQVGFSKLQQEFSFKPDVLAQDTEGYKGHVRHLAV